MNDFITIYFETGKYSTESAISVGLVKYRNYEPIDSYYSLIRPLKLYIRQDFTEIHGLTVDDVRDAPDFGFLWKNEIKKFIGKTMLAAQTPLTTRSPAGNLCRWLRRSLIQKKALRNFWNIWELGKIIWGKMGEK